MAIYGFPAVRAEHRLSLFLLIFFDKSRSQNPRQKSHHSNSQEGNQGANQFSKEGYRIHITVSDRR